MTGKKYENTFHAGDMVDAPIVKLQEYTLIRLEGTMITLLDKNGNLRQDLDLPENESLANTIKRIMEEEKCVCEVTVLKTMGKEIVSEVREGEKY